MSAASPTRSYSVETANDDSVEILEEDYEQPAQQQQEQDKTEPLPKTARKESNMADLLGNATARKILSYLIAKLEINNIDNRKTMFRANWARQNFYAGLQDLKPGLTPENFNIDKWYNLILHEQTKGPCRYIDGTDLASMNPDIENDWVSPLLEAEKNIPGFIKLLYGVLCLEDDAHTNVRKISKQTRFDSGPQPVQSIGLLTYR